MEMTCAVKGEGWVCVRQAREKVAWVVGIRAMRSYVLKRVTLALIYVLKKR